MKKLLLCAVALFASAALFTSCGGASTPTATVDNALSCAIDGDWGGYLEYVNSPAEQKALMEGILVEKGDEAFPYTAYTIVGEEISEDGKTAEATIEYTEKDGSTKKDSEDLELVDGVWLIED